MQLLVLLLSVFSLFRATVADALPGKIYGVNLGSWLLIEPWMLPEEWKAMGGEICDWCSTCIASEFAFAAAYPDTVDKTFAQHWATWFTQEDVNTLKDAGINAVRVPLGYWIVEALVDRSQEHYARGGMKYLADGLKWLQDAGIQVILDHHALPGVSSANQMFAGNCTDNVQFYTDYNYGRALTWTAVMTALSHLHPSFKSVFSIQAINEPTMDASKTPGYGDFQKNFVKVVRATELLLGIPVPGAQPLQQSHVASSVVDMSGWLADASDGDTTGLFTAAVVKALAEAIPIVAGLEVELGSLDLKCKGHTPLFTNFMDKPWQYNNGPNPADAAIGPQAYDHHLYYSFGGVAPSDPEAYLRDICNRNIAKADIALRNTPMWVGEWSLATQFNATDEFLLKWADAQKIAYSQDAGWLFWNFKLEHGNPLERQWSYLEGLKCGYLTQDPSQLHNPNVCDPYKNVTSPANNTSAVSSSTSSSAASTPSHTPTPVPQRRGPQRHRQAKQHWHQF